MTLLPGTVPVRITYAVWSGMGIIVVAITGAGFYKQISSLPLLQLDWTLLLREVSIIRLLP